MMKQSPFFKLAAKQKNKMLNHYHVQLHQQQVMLGIVKSALPESLKDRANHCVANQNKLFIYTDSAAWASQLRFYAGDIVAALRSWHHYAHLENVQIRLSTDVSIKPVRTRDPNIPSQPTIRLIGRVREDKDDVLSKALNALSNTLDKCAKRVKPAE